MARLGRSFPIKSHLGTFIGSSTGTTLTLSVADTVTLSETVAVTESALILTASETITLSEALVVAVPLPISVSETITLSESVNLALSLPVSVTDTITLSELAIVLITNLVPSVSDTITLSESVNLALPLPINVSDTITLSESVTVSLPSGAPLTLSVSETINLTESVKLGVALPASASDTVTLSEAVTMGVSLPVSTTETITLTDIVGYFPELIVLTEVINIALVSVNTLTLSVSDTLTLSEAVKLNLPLPVVATDTITLSDTVGESEALPIRVSETITISESVTGSLPSSSTLTISVNNTVTLSEDVSIFASLPLEPAFLWPFNGHFEINLSTDTRGVSSRFTAITTGNVDKLYSLNGVDIGTPTGTVKYGIQSDSGGFPSGVWLGATNQGYSTIPVSSLSASAAIILGENVSLTSGTIYHAVVDYNEDGTLNPSNRVNWQPLYDRNIYLPWDYDYPGQKRTDINGNILTKSDTGVWTIVTNGTGFTGTPNYGLHYTDGTIIGQIYSSNYESVVNVTGNNWASITFRARQADYTVATIGVRAQYYSQDFLLQYEIRDNLENILASGSFTKFLTYQSGGYHWIEGDISPSIDLIYSNTYRLVLKFPGHPDPYYYLLAPINGSSDSVTKVLNYDTNNSYYSQSSNSGVTWTDYPAIAAPFYFGYSNRLIHNIASVNDSITLSESVTLSLVASSTLTINSSETIALSESVQLALPLPVRTSDTITLSETVIVNELQQIAATETITLTDIVGYFPELIVITEAINVALVSINTLFVSVSETITISESVKLNVSLPVVATDTITVTDTPGESEPLPISVSETITLTEEIGWYEELIVVFDTVSVQLVSVTSLAISVSDTITVSETVSVLITNLVPNVSDTVTLSEAVTVTEVEQINVSETVTLSDTSQVTLALPISVTETITLSETVTMAGTDVISATETVTLSETVSVSLGVTLAVADTITLSETVSVQTSALIISVSDTITLTEVIGTTSSILTISVSDTIGKQIPTIIVVEGHLGYHIGGNYYIKL